ncbi:MAG: hypothetical protein ABFD92_21490 [Planctomycetaceae bacterium]
MGELDFLNETTRSTRTAQGTGKREAIRRPPQPPRKPAGPAKWLLWAVGVPLLLLIYLVCSAAYHAATEPKLTPNERMRQNAIADLKGEPRPYDY